MRLLAKTTRTNRDYPLVREREREREWGPCSNVRIRVFLLMQTVTNLF